jgi:YwiC-like protein
MGPPTILIPREHGAYGQLGFPIAAALGAGRPSAAALALALGFVAAFLAHEALLVLLGLRGPRARREQGRVAVRDGAWMSALALAGVSIGALLITPANRWTILVPIACALGIAGLVLQHVEKTTAGEMFVALTTASCALPIGAAAGVALPGAGAIWLVMALGYWAATAAVRGTIARQRREPHGALRAFGASLALVAAPAVYLVARLCDLHPSIWIAAVPLSALSLVLAIVAPAARHLRRIGWALIGASTVAAVLLAVLVRR